MSKNSSLPVTAAALLVQFLFMPLLTQPALAQVDDAQTQEVTNGNPFGNEEAFDQQVALIPDEKIRSAISILGLVYCQMLSIEGREFPAALEPEYIEDPYFLKSKYESPEAAVDVYVKGLEAQYFLPSNSNYVSIIPPFDLYFTHKLEWQELLLENGEKLRVLPEAPDVKKAGQVYAYEYASGVNLWKWGENSDDPWGRLDERQVPVRLSGKLVATVAKNWNLSEFTKSDIGQERSIGDFLVTLTDISDSVAIFEVNVKRDSNDKDLKFEDFRIEARDNTGQYLERGWKTSSGDPRFLAAFGIVLEELVYMAQAGKIDEDEIEKYGEAKLEELGIKKSGLQTFKYSFAGPVDTLSVMLLSPADKIEVIREISLPVINRKPD